MIQQAILDLIKYKNLTSEQMQAVMEEIMSGKAYTPVVVSFLEALNKKGETVEELAAAATVMRHYAIKIQTRHSLVLDNCGTGGDEKDTFNISTVSAFVASGAGIAVAKHGNRSVSSCCGSADILEYSGININIPPEKISACLDEAGIAFLFAPNLHPAMKYAVDARRQIGKRTIFNLLGPLTNPASATHQLIGVYEKEKTELVAKALAKLGASHALVVCGKDGLDEITTTDLTYISELRNGKISNYEIDPRLLGMRPGLVEDLKAENLKDNYKIMFNVLEGKFGAHRDIVLLNAAAAIYTADKASSMEEGINLAANSIDSGAALRKFELLKQFSS